MPGSEMDVGPQLPGVSDDIESGSPGVAGIRLRQCGQHWDERGLAVVGILEVALATGGRGMSNKQIAERLVITPKTAGNHLEHIYAKIDVSSRAAAAMFAVQHRLLPESEDRRNRDLLTPRPRRLEMRHRARRPYPAAHLRAHLP